MLPLALSVGAGVMSALPLDARQGEEFFLTAAQSLFGIALLMRLRLSLWSALALTGLFAVQVGLAFYYRNDEARTIATLTALAWVYLGLAALLFLINGRRLIGLLRDAFVAAPSSLALAGKSLDDVPPRGDRKAKSVAG